MIEAVNKQLKYRYLFTKDLADFGSTVEHLKVSIPEFNEIRPYGPLFGLTPAEAFSGKRPEKNKFLCDMRKARIERNNINRLSLCPLCGD